MSNNKPNYFNTVQLLQTQYYALYTQLVIEINSNYNTFFKYEKSILDPFQDITKDDSILNQLYNWYESINPEYKTLKKLNPSIPSFNNIQPYKSLLLSIAKDLIILQETKKFPKPKISHINNNNLTILNNNNNNNTRKKKQRLLELRNQNTLKSRNNSLIVNNSNITNSRNLTKRIGLNNTSSRIINTLLELINKILNNKNESYYYKYLHIVDVIDKYLLLFSFGKKNHPKHSQKLMNTLDTPFIVYPTFNMISYTKVVYFIQAPVLNFNIMNTRKMVHTLFEFPYYQVFHDIEFHSFHTHSYSKEQELSLKDIFTKTNSTINLLKNYINYDLNKLKQSNITIDDIDVKKFILCYVFFQICHEKEYGILFFSSFKSIIETIKNNIIYLFHNNYKYDTYYFKGDIINTFPQLTYFHSLLSNLSDFDLCELAITNLETLKL